ncbi:MAG: hypothetical protein VX453_00985 [Acidobacteriota bacterium]|nr:hypothetical protein [Acidobacteriota bacterium]
MRNLSIVLGLIGVVGITEVEVAAQNQRPFIQNRTCDVAPGQNAAAVALAREFIDLANEVAESGRVGAFQSLKAPFDQVHFLAFQPDMGAWQTLFDTLAAREDWQALLQEGQEVFTGGCVDSFFRVVP